MERGALSRNALDDGDQIPIAAFDLLNHFLIAVNKRRDLVADSKLDALEQSVN